MNGQGKWRAGKEKKNTNIRNKNPNKTHTYESNKGVKKKMVGSKIKTQKKKIKK